MAGFSFILRELPAGRGPLVKKAWLVHIPRQNARSLDWTAGFARASVPAVRVHGMGCVDMDLLWLPRTADGGMTYAGQDASLAANYDWTIADECVKNAVDAGLVVDIRFGHSRALKADHPSYSQGPDDAAVFAQVCAEIADRYVNVKGYGATGLVRDFSVWNEPSSPFEDHEVSPFYVGTSADYEEMYYAVFKEIKHTRSATLGAKVRIGAALGLDDFSTAFLAKLKTRPAAYAGMDFIDFHAYPASPSTLEYQIWGKGAGSMEGQLTAAGWPKDTPILIGEWSRTIPLYAVDGPGTAFVASGLAHLNAMAPGNGAHAVERGFLYASQKIWDGAQSGAPDLNAATAMNWWARLAGGAGAGAGGAPPTMAMLQTTGSALPATKHDTVDFVVVASTAAGGGGDEVLLMASHYDTQGLPKGQKPSAMACFPLELSVDNVPWAKWSWTQYSNVLPNKLVATAAGCGDSTTTQLALQMHGNAFVGVRIADATSTACTGLPESDAYPAATLTPAEMAEAATRRCGGGWTATPTKAPTAVQTTEAPTAPTPQPTVPNVHSGAAAGRATAAGHNAAVLGMMILVALVAGGGNF